jgi:hypothetical protein
VDKFVIGWSNESFSTAETSPLSFAPFEHEILSFSRTMMLFYIDIKSLPEARSMYRNETAWKREAAARNYLIEGVNMMHPTPNDLILLCDVDEIVSRQSIGLIRSCPPAHYYNLWGSLYHYSFRWRVTDWKRPLVIRYGAIQAPLDNYKFMPFLFPLPGVHHYHCSFCFPTIAGIFRKLRSFSHTEFAVPKFMNPNYIYARIACGYGTIPPMWKQPEVLVPVDFDPNFIFLPGDTRLEFLRWRIGFTDLDDFQWNMSQIRQFMPRNCTVTLTGREQVRKVL